MIEDSKSLQEALLLHLMKQQRPDIQARQELEILDIDMRSCGQWRLIFWVRPLPETRLHEHFGGSIRTLVVHENSIVTIVDDTPMPAVPGR